MKKRLTQTSEAPQNWRARECRATDCSPDLIEFEVGDGRLGRAQVSLFAPAAPDEPTAALVEAPPGGGGYPISLHAPAIAEAICARARIAPENLLYIERDQAAAHRLADLAIFLGPQATFAYTVAASEDGLPLEVFHLVAFDFVAGALANPRVTPLSRLDVEELLGTDFEAKTNPKTKPKPRSKKT